MCFFGVGEWKLTSSTASSADAREARLEDAGVQAPVGFCGGQSGAPRSSVVSGDERSTAALANGSHRLRVDQPPSLQP